MSNSQPNINKRFMQSFETVQEEIKDENIVNHFSIIENFDQLKEIVRIIDNNDLTASLELIQNNNLIDQIKVAEALTKLLNFTENYNNILNNLNIYNNTERCNKLCEKSKNELKTQQIKNKHVYSDVEIKCKNIEIQQQNQLFAAYNEIDEEQQKLILKNNNKQNDILSNKITQLQIQKEKISKKIFNLDNKKDILRGKIKEKRGLFSFIFHKKEQIILTEQERNISNSKNENLKRTNDEFDLKYNSLIMSSNSKYENSIKILGKDTIELNNRFLEKLNSKLADSYYRKRLFETIVEKVNLQNTGLQEIDFDDILVPKDININLINYLSSKIHERNKQNYNDFIATSLNDVIFVENTHIQKINKNLIHVINKELSNCKSISYASGMLFSGLTQISKLILPEKIVKPLEKLSTVLKESAKIYNHELPELPDFKKSLVQSTKQIDEMFNKFSFLVKTKKDYDKYINSFSKVQKINIHKNKDIFARE